MKHFTWESDLCGQKWKLQGYDGELTVAVLHKPYPKEGVFFLDSAQLQVRDGLLDADTLDEAKAEGLQRLWEAAESIIEFAQEVMRHIDEDRGNNDADA